MSSLEVDYELMRAKLAAAIKLITEVKDHADDHGLSLRSMQEEVGFSQLLEVVDQCNTNQSGWQSSSYNC